MLQNAILICSFYFFDFVFSKLQFSYFLCLWLKMYLYHFKCGGSFFVFDLQIACRDYPHPRHLCVLFPFSSTPHEKHCDQVKFIICCLRLCQNLDLCVSWFNYNSFFLSLWHAVPLLCVWLCRTMSEVGHWLFRYRSLSCDREIWDMEKSEEKFQVGQDCSITGFNKPLYFEWCHKFPTKSYSSFSCDVSKFHVAESDININCNTYMLPSKFHTSKSSL